MWDWDLKGEQLPVAKGKKYKRFCFEWQRRIPFPCCLTPVRPLLAVRMFRASAAWAAAQGGALGWERRGTGVGEGQIWSPRGMQGRAFPARGWGPSEPVVALELGFGGSFGRRLSASLLYR